MNDSEQDLHWLAYQYATGEMTAAEEERFEQRLADDQAAREAVERAVELHETLRLARPEPVLIRRRSSLVWRKAAALGVGLAASLLVAFGAYLAWNPNTPDPSGVTVSPPPHTSEMARAWVELRQVPSDAMESDLDEPEFEVDEVATTDVAVPPWMLAAFAEPK